MLKSLMFLVLSMTLPMVGKGASVRKEVVRRIVALMLFTLALSGAVWAQSFDHKVRAEIPFSFYAGSKLLPAGAYTLRFNIENHSLMIVNNLNADGARLMGYPTTAGKDGPSALIFRTNGEGVYALDSLKATDFALSFQADKTLAHFAINRKTDTTTVTRTRAIPTTAFTRRATSHTDLGRAFRSAWG